MAKYEDILLEDFKKLNAKKEVLVQRLDSAALNLHRVRQIDKYLKEQDWILLKSIFMWKKIRQLVRCDNKAQSRFIKLLAEFYPLNKKISDIRSTLFKYYDNQIEECIRELGMDNVQNLEDLILKLQAFEEEAKSDGNEYDTDTTRTEE